MRITMEEELTVQQIRDRIAGKYGSVEALAAHVKKSPDDIMARLALEDAREYAQRDPNEVVRETRDLIIPDDALDRLTLQRVRLLLTMKAHQGEVDGVRDLARLLRRDVKNVSEDVQVLSDLGLLRVEARGRGRAKRVTLPARRIDLHLVEA